MTTRFLLTCACGREIAVARCQAGESVRCDCGASLSVPPLREMMGLRPAEPDLAGSRPAANWGLHQRLVLLGIVVLLGCVGPAVYLYHNRPLAPDPEQVAELARREITALTPLQSWQVWQMARSRGLAQSTAPLNPKYEEQVLTYRVWVGVVLGIGAVGVALLGIGWFAKPRPGNYPTVSGDSRARDPAL